jgi:O-antigen ligase
MKIIIFGLFLYGIVIPFHGVLIKFFNIKDYFYYKEIFIIIIFYFTCITFLIHKKKTNRLLAKINAPVFLFAAICLFSALLHFSLLSFYGFAGYILGVIIFIIITTQFSIFHAISMVKSLIFVGLFLSIGAIIQFAGPSNLFHLIIPHFTKTGEIVRVGSFMGGSPNILGTYLSLLIPPSFIMCAKKTKKSITLLYFMITVIMFIGTILTFSRSVYLQVFVSFLFLSIFNYRYKLHLRLSRLTILILISFCLFWIGIRDVNILEIISERFSFLFDVSEESVRITRWKGTLSFIFSKFNFIIGGGPGTGWLFGSLDTIQRSTLMRKLALLTPGTPSPEHFYLLILADLGIIGLISYFYLYITFIILGLRQVRYFKARNSEISNICLGVTIGLIGLILGFSSFLTNWAISFLFWFYCSIIAVADRLRRRQIISAKNILIYK